ncbi:MAG: 16S rRNA (guanine(966)-N(2))-methyltransferase RsmD [Bacillota bacterium]|nr:16S rRNA (guanine(966)-N(2))-methyltransferase RsmD [Bacillota bacterium]
MRIIAGEWRGRKLGGPAPATRPTSDRVREAVFDLLQGRWEARGAVLDLFAGTGALALEALSRGAQRAVLVEVDPAALRVIRRNVAACGAGARVRLLGTDWRRALLRLEREGERFGIVFLDPPYRQGLLEEALRALAGREDRPAPLLEPGALLVAERARGEELPEGVGSFIRLDERRYGDTVVAILTRG